MLPLVSQLDGLLGPGDVPTALVASIRSRATAAKAAAATVPVTRRPRTFFRSQLMWRRASDPGPGVSSPRSGPRRGTVLASVAAAISFVIVSVAVLGLVNPRAGSHPAVGNTGSGQHVAAGPPIDWDSGEVLLIADSLRIVTASHTFTGAGISRRAPANSFACVTTGDCIDIHSGRSSKSATLELQWMEAGVEMKVNLYFALGAAKWWVTEIRTYDGRKSGDWLEWQGHWFETPVGGTWSGDLDLTNGKGNYHRSDGLTPTGDLHISGMRLTVDP